MTATDTSSAVSLVFTASGLSGPPRLQGLPGGGRLEEGYERTVEVTHSDTEDLRLLRAGWTLGRAVDPDAREEWVLERPGAEPLRVPAEGADVPAELLAQVRVHTRGHALTPVAHTQTTSSTTRLLGPDGALRATVTTAAVSAQTLGSSTTVDSWYRITVELARRDDELLAALRERLDDVGARPVDPEPPLRLLLGDQVPAPARAPRRIRKKSTAGDVLVATLAGHVARLRDLDGQVRRDEPDAVHQMRVTVRTLRSALRSFRDVVDGAATTEIGEELRWLGTDVLGASRDQEVVQERVERHLAATPADLVLGPVGARLSQQFAREQVEAHARTVAELDTDRYYALLDALDRLVADPPLTRVARKPAREVLPPLVAHAVRRVDRAVARIAELPAGPERDESLHDARKAAKRARYAADTLVPLVGDDAARTSASMKAVQQLLGEHQDTVATRAFLRAQGGRGHLAGQNGFTYGLWYQQEAQAAERAAAELPAVHARTRGKKLRRWMR